MFEFDSGTPRSEPGPWAPGLCIGPTVVVNGVETRRYKLSEAVLGEGGMGMVYLALDQGLENRPVALKRCADKNPEAKEYRRFLAEASVTTRIGHPNILTIFDRGIHEDGYPWYAMEHLHCASSLAQHIRNAREGGERKPASVLTDWFVEVTRALVATHALKVRHRDIKPSNILVAPTIDGSWAVRLIDFGVAHDPEQVVPLTANGEFVGTPAYNYSPEQYRNWKGAFGIGAICQYRADIWALGVTFYEAFSNQHPYPALVEKNPNVEHWEIFSSPTTYPQSLRTLNPEVPPHIEAIVHRCLERDPDERFASAEEVLAALRQECAIQPYVMPALSELRARHAEPETLPNRHLAPVPNQGARWPWAMAAAAVAVVGVFGVTAVVNKTPSPVAAAVAFDPNNVVGPPATLAPPPPKVETPKPVRKKPTQIRPAKKRKRPFLPMSLYTTRTKRTED